MNTVRLLGRLLVPFSLVVLVACQNMPGKKTTTAADTTRPGTASPTQAAPESTPAAQGAPVTVYLADTAERSGWTAVQIPSGTIYVNPQPVLTRNDLTGVKAGTSKDGDGLLALDLSDEGRRKISEVTTQNPNKRLALVVGRTMMAAPGFTGPVNTSQLVFAVGTEQNATAAAHAIAGNPGNGGASAVQGQAPSGTAPAPAPQR